MNISDSNAPITVLMPVYNAERYVGEAIESILNQTFRDFKFLIMKESYQCILYLKIVNIRNALNVFF